MRLFLAVDLPDSLRRELGGLQRRLRSSLTGWRWIRAEAIHLTIRFLGEVAEEEDARQRVAWRRASASCPRVRFRVGGTGVFPPRGGPRVLWAGIGGIEPSDGLTRLSEAMERAARAQGFRPETRPFRPHLTLARAGRRGRPDRPEDSDAAVVGEVEVREVVLFRSRLDPQGARYTRLDAFPLAPPTDTPA
jgi:2'-5' RNA ligase